MSAEAQTAQLPPDVAAIVRDLEAVDREAERVVAGLSEAQLNWQPDGGRAWSIAQCLDHLRIGARVFLDAMAAALAEGRAREVRRRGAIRPGLLEKMFVDYMEPPPRMRGKAPKKIVPGSHLRAADVLPGFLAVQAEARSVLAGAADLDLNAVRFTNPFLRFVKVRVGAGFLIIAAHDRRHLWQAGRVLQREGFPAA